MESPAEFAAEFKRLSGLLDGALGLVKEQVHELANAEAGYRKEKAKAWVQCPNDPPGVKVAEREWTAARREAWVDAETADLRMKRDIAEGMVKAGMEAVKSRRTQISALQSMLGAVRKEMAFERTVPRGAA